MSSYVPRIVRAITRVVLLSFAVLASLAVTAQRFDYTELLAWIVITIAHVAIEAAVMFYDVAPGNSDNRGRAHAGTLAVVIGTITLLALCPQPTPRKSTRRGAFQFDPQYHTNVETLRRHP